MATPMSELKLLLSDLHQASLVLSEHEGDDVARVRKLMGAMGQSFTTTVFAFQQIGTVKDQVHFIATLAEKFPTESWLGVVAAEQFRKPIGTLRTRYALADTAALHERAAKLAPGLSGSELLTLSRALLVYHGFLSRQMRELLPIYELAVAFEGQKAIAERVKASPMGRGIEG